MKIKEILNRQFFYKIKTEKGVIELEFTTLQKFFLIFFTLALISTIVLIPIGILFYIVSRIIISKININKKLKEEEIKTFKKQIAKFPDYLFNEEFIDNIGHAFFKACADPNRTSEFFYFGPFTIKFLPPFPDNTNSLERSLETSFVINFNDDIDNTEFTEDYHQSYNSKENNKFWSEMLAKLNTEQLEEYLRVVYTKMSPKEGDILFQNTDRSGGFYIDDINWVDENSKILGIKINFTILHSMQTLNRENS